jgi:hypothetical protein
VLRAGLLDPSPYTASFLEGGNFNAGGVSDWGMGAGVGLLRVYVDDLLTPRLVVPLNLEVSGMQCCVFERVCTPARTQLDCSCTGHSGNLLWDAPICSSSVCCDALALCGAHNARYVRPQSTYATGALGWASQPALAQTCGRTTTYWTGTSRRCASRGCRCQHQRARTHGAAIQTYALWRREHLAGRYCTWLACAAIDCGAVVYNFVAVSLVVDISTRAPQH